MKILVGLSGGVDSTVAALILKEQGHEIEGAIMSIWTDDGRLAEKGVRNACYGPDEAVDIKGAEKIADALGIPFHVIKCSEKYNELVLNNFKSEYIKGRTPNPCIRCNAMIKFGAFPELAKMQGVKFDKFATGHYARIEQDKKGRYFLKQGIVPQKDQSYFLHRLTQEQLSKIILPLGEYTKEEIRTIAKAHGLEVAEKPDSQDFFDGDYNILLDVKEKEGNIINTEGKILGKHNGIWNYTVGQRKGIGISAPEPLYVIELKSATNEVVVGYRDKTFNKGLIATDINWQSIDFPNNPINTKAKIRSTQTPTDVLIEPISENSAKVTFTDLQKSIAIGQSVVFYNNDIVLGGGIINEVF